jgi:esterase/lipase superfamily enzyme
MGNWVAVETFRQLRASGARFPDHKIGMIALASPDIDLDVFRAQMRRIGPPKKPFLIILSRDDKALQVSSFIAGGQKRLGATDDIQELAALGATVIDMTDVTTGDSLNHGKFAELAAVGPGLADVLRRGLGPSRPDGAAENLGSIISLPLRVINAPLSALRN